MSKSFLFSIVFLILCHIPSFFSCFSHQSAQIHLGGFTHALRDNGPTSEPQFYLASFYPLPILSTVFIAFTLSLFFPPFLLLSHVFHSFMSKSFLFSIVFLILCHIPSFFLLFFSSICPDPPRRAVRGESISKSFLFSIVFLILCHIPSFFLLFFSSICPDPPRRADQGGIDTPTSPNCHLVHNPKKSLPGPPFLPPIFLIFDRFGSLCPQTPLNSLCSQK